MRRCVDLLVALATMIVLLPVLIVVAILVTIDSPGNPFYRAVRCGRKGRPFQMWKFRTMISRRVAGPSITGRNDPRITRLGKVLRATKIDELPQFVNVFLGDMTLVGPRPETPSIVARYTPAQLRVLDVKPGITGRQQLAGEESESMPADAEPEDYYITHILNRKLGADLDYIRTRSVRTDVAILFSTAGYVLRSIQRRRS